jgi:hypothetical protein
MEALKFSDQTVNVRVPAAPTNVTATAGNGSASLTWTRAVANGGPAVTSQEIVVSNSTGVVSTITGIAATATTRSVTGLTNGTAYTFQVRAVNPIGAGALSVASAPVTPVGPATAPLNVQTVRGNATVGLSWTAPANSGGLAITGYEVQVRIGTTVIRTDSVPGTGTSTTVTGLINGQPYRFAVRAITAFGPGALSAVTPNVTPATVPDAPVIGAPTQGPAGGALTAIANWSAPANTGGSAITNYRVTALTMAADGTTATSSTSVIVGQAVRTRSFTLPAGTYRFEVVAINAVGDSLPSARSETVVPR